MALAVISMKKEKLPLIEKKDGKVYWLIIGIMVACGICVAANHKLNLGLSGKIPSAVFFPIVNGGNLVLTTLSALIIFRERLTKRQWIGVIFGIASVLFLCMPTEWIFSFELKDVLSDPWSYRDFVNALS
jgi:drug/metabolite transporter (DMT)-like permease